MKVKRFILRGSKLTGLLVFALMVGLGSAAYATPSLGIGTGELIDPCSELNYWECFTGDYASGSEDMGFLIDGSPQTLTLFSNIEDANIYLMTTADVYEAATSDGGDLTFAWGSSDPVSFEEVAVDNSFKAYKETPYYGVNVGMINSSTINSLWFPIDNPVFDPEPFYSLEGTLTYDNPLPPGSYFFLVADDNGISSPLQGDSSTYPGYGPDSCSPRTSSAKVPEPSTLSMLVAGGILFVFGLVIRKRVFPVR